MPILLILLVSAACLQVPWPEPRFGPADDPRARAEWATAATAAVTCVPLAAASALSGWVVWTLGHDPFRRPGVSRAYGRLRRKVGYLNLIAAAVAVVGCGWGWTVWHAWPELLVSPVAPAGSRPVLFPGAELLVAAPYFAAVLLGWVIYYPAERVLHDTSFLVPKVTHPPAYWSLPGYLLFNGRQFVLFVLLPAAMLSLQQGAARVLPEWAAAGWLQLGLAAVTLTLLVLMPRAVKPILGLQPMPPGPDRTRLEATARRLGLTYTDLLLWPTRGAATNAMVLGLVPWARYVVFTDRLLESLTPDELDAVLGHEIGHVRHHHIPFYVGFLMASAAATSAAAAAAAHYLKGLGVEVPDDEWMVLPMLLGMVAYLFVVFGLLSRRCERQADVFGSRAGSCGNPYCAGHDEKTVLVPGGRGLCPTGVRAMIDALDRVDALTGSGGHGGHRTFRERLWGLLRAWQHAPIADRIEFLAALAANPALGDRTDRRVNRFRAVLMAVLLAVVAGLGSVVGWSELWRMM